MGESKHRKDKLWNGFLAAMFIIGAAARISPIAANRFHQDEALYSYWAVLIASGRDMVLSSVQVDKPPLFLYGLALAFKLLGPSELTARLISEATSIASIGLLYYLASKLYDRPTALAATTLMALSPFNILFAPTAFTDPLMVAWVLTALCLATRGRPGWSGIALGLAMATKQQGAFFAPLVIFLNALHSKAASAKGWMRFVFGVLVVMGPTTWWDSLRWHIRPSYLERSLTTYGGLAIVEPSKLGERLMDWANVLSYVTASTPLNLLLLIGLPVLLAYDLRHKEDRKATLDLALGAFVACFLLAHWLLNFNVWDRYLLGIVPLLAMLIARTLLLAVERTIGGNFAGPIAILLLIVCLTMPAWRAAHSGYPIGGDHWAYEGIDQVANYFREEAPAGSILYHRWLGWHYSFYLFDFPLDLRWYNSPSKLAEEASQEADSRRYIVFPSWKSEAGVQSALAEEELALYPLHQLHRRDGSLSFTIYEIEEVGQSHRRDN